MNNVGVVARVLAKPGKEGLALKELENMVAPTRNEPGCFKYVLYRSADNPCEFWFVEEWSNLDALEKHKQTPHYLTLAERKAEFAQTAEVTVLLPL